MKKVILCLISLMMLSGCVSMPITNYTPQNTDYITKYKGSASIGEFTYVLFEQGKVKSNQIANTALGNFYLEGEVADFVRKANIIELERTGISLVPSSSVIIVGKIKDFSVDDLGFSGYFTYKINYKIIEKKTSAIIFERDYIETRRESKFNATLSSVITILNDLVYSGYDKFIRDPEVRKLLESK